MEVMEDVAASFVYLMSKGIGVVLLFWFVFSYLGGTLLAYFHKAGDD